MGLAEPPTHPVFKPSPRSRSTRSLGGGSTPKGAWSERVVAAIAAQIARAVKRGIGVVHYSIQDTHLHLIVEAVDKVAPKTRGIFDPCLAMVRFRVLADGMVTGAVAGSNPSASARRV